MHVVGEILDGELIVGQRPASPRAIAATRLGVELGGPFDRGRAVRPEPFGAVELDLVSLWSR